MSICKKIFGVKETEIFSSESDVSMYKLSKKMKRLEIPGIKRREYITLVYGGFLRRSLGWPEMFYEKLEDFSDGGLKSADLVREIDDYFEEILSNTQKYFEEDLSFDEI